MKRLFIAVTVLFTGCAEKKTVSEGDLPPLFTGNPTNYEVVEANGLYAIAKGSFISHTYTNCQDAAGLAERMRALDRRFSEDESDSVREMEKLRQLPWKRTDCGQETEILNNGTNVEAKNKAYYASLTNQSGRLDLVATNAFAVIPYQFDLSPTNSFFTMMTNGETLVDIRLDGTVLLANTNLDDLSKRFWYHVVEVMPSVMEHYCAYLTNRATK